MKTNNRLAQAIEATPVTQDSILSFDLKGLHLSAGRNTLTFESIRFELSNNVPFGVILGASGVGKTVMLKSLFKHFRDEWNSDGRFEVIETHTMNGLPLRSLETSIGYAAQRPYFLPKETVMSNLLAPCRWTGAPGPGNAGIERIISDFRLELLLDHKAYLLSAGERQRLNLARMFLMAPSVAIIDECLSSMDECLAREIAKVLDSVYAHASRILIVSHRSSDMDGLRRRTILLSAERDQNGRQLVKGEVS